MNVTHLPALISDLCLILAAAAVFTILFRSLKQPSVLGYIVAGFLIGPHFHLLPTVSDTANIQVWAEIGVLFLLFALGLEFSFRKLARVGGAASVTALVEVVAMVLIGYLTGQLFGWSQMDSLFLGGILSISSTTIILRAFEEAGVKGRGFVNLVFGVLIVEDLIAILLLVLLSTIAISQSAAGAELMLAIIKLLFFLTLWFIAGMFLLPTIMNRLRSHLNDETLVVVSVGLCFVMVVLSVKAGFSPALGAFVMGSLLAETQAGKRIEHVIEPVKNLFAAVFFVSVGMLIDPVIIYKYSTEILILTAVTITGKAVSTAIGALVSGRSLRHSVQSGLSLAQIGEFSFIIAGLGVTLTVTSDFLYPIAVGVSALTTFSTPYLIRSGDYVVGVVERSMPQPWKRKLDDYASLIAGLAVGSEWSALAQAYAFRMIINAVIIIAIFVSLSELAIPALRASLEYPWWIDGVGLAAALLLSAPFFWALVAGRIRSGKLDQMAAKPEHRIAVFFFVLSRWLIAVGLFAALAPQFISFHLALMFAMAAVFLLLVVFSRNLEWLYARIESRFVKNMAGTDPAKHMPPLAPWDAHLISLEVSSSCAMAGGSLENLKIREQFGVTIALIERGGRRIPAPGRGDQLLPGDRIYVIGTDEEIVRLRAAVESSVAHEASDEFNYVLRPYWVFPESPYLGRTIRDSGIREKSQGLIVGVERAGMRQLNPDSAMVIESGDLLWVVGDRAALRGI